MIEKITDEEVRSLWIQRLPDAPNRGGRYGTRGMSAAELKAAYDALSLRIVSHYNALVDHLNNGELSEQLPGAREGTNLSEFLEDIRSGALSAYLTVDGTRTLAALAAAYDTHTHDGVYAPVEDIASLQRAIAEAGQSGGDAIRGVRVNGAELPADSEQKITLPVNAMVTAALTGAGRIAGLADQEKQAACSVLGAVPENRFDMLWSLSEGVSYTCSTDIAPGEKSVPKGAKYASIEAIGGKTELKNGHLVDANIESVKCGDKVVGGIPQAVRSLDGYGCSLGNLYNGIERTETGWQYVKKAGKADMGALTWTYENVQVSEIDWVRVFVSSAFPGAQTGNTQDPNILCEKYTLNSFSEFGWWSNDKIIGIGSGSFYPGCLVVQDSTYQSAESFQAAMSGIGVYYELKESVITDITEHMRGFPEWFPVEEGKSLSFENAEGAEIPNTVKYIREHAGAEETSGEFELVEAIDNSNFDQPSTIIRNKWPSGEDYKFSAVRILVSKSDNAAPSGTLTAGGTFAFSGVQGQTVMFENIEINASVGSGVFLAAYRANASCFDESVSGEVTKTDKKSTVETCSSTVIKSIKIVLNSTYTAVKIFGIRA